MTIGGSKWVKTGFSILLKRLRVRSLCVNVNNSKNYYGCRFFNNISSPPFGIVEAVVSSRCLQFPNLFKAIYGPQFECDVSELILSEMGKTKGGFYAVAKGRQIGIFRSWDECKVQIDGFPDSRFKKFPEEKEAQDFIDANSILPSTTAIAMRVQKNVENGLKAEISFQPSNSKRGIDELFNFRRDTTESKSKSSLPIPIPIDGRVRATMKSSRLFLSSAGSSFGSILISGSAPPTTGTGTGSRAFSTTSSCKVTDDRITGSKRPKLELDFTAEEHLDLSSFDLDNEGYVIVFTDGACPKNGRRGALAGIGVWFGANHYLNISEPVLGRQTNNTAEIQAAERAILQAKNAGIRKLKLMTDSQFTINCATQWVEKWKSNGWKLTTGKDVKNKEDLAKLAEAMDGIEIKWSYVPGHKGHLGNEAADCLAVEGAHQLGAINQKYKKSK